MKNLSFYIQNARKNPKERRLQLAQFIDDFLQSKDLSSISQRVRLKDPLASLFIATAHQLTLDFKLKTPEWLMNYTPLKEPYFVSELEGMKMLALRDSPYAFRLRNIYVTRNFLQRV
ncbi:MAG TPA: hypothetical protein PLJ21_13360 [Pseudobdellovibrionaceae bacterium]|nr:hypothetical protein [Pseudobdellovibrionaceae bacterium]